MWSSFDPERYGLTHKLRDHFSISISDEPEYLFFSVFGDSHLERTAYRKIFVTHEAAYPDFRFCDYALSFYWPMASKRHLYYPNFLHYTSWRGLSDLAESHNRRSISDDDQPAQFCAFLVSNGNSPARNRIFEGLSSYKRVLSGGKFANNLGEVVQPNQTISFLRDCKFVISGENSISPGYVTEKILQAMIAGTVPIYWGDIFVKEIFNPRRFIYARDFASTDDLVKRVAEIDQDPAEYESIVRQPVFKAGKVPGFLGASHISHFFHQLFSGALDNEPIPKLNSYRRAAIIGQHRRRIEGPMSSKEIRLADKVRSQRRAQQLSD